MALYGPARAAVLLRPAEGRWPRHEAHDRLALGLGAAALGAHRAPASRWRGYRTALTRLASGVAAAGDGPLPGDLAPLEPVGGRGELAVVAWEGPGRASAEVRLLAAVDGLVPRLSGRPRGRGPAREVVALALLLALAADGDAEARLALALGVEGVVAWFAQSDRLGPPRDAMRFAMDHAARRLAAAGRRPPAGR